MHGCSSMVMVWRFRSTERQRTYARLFGGQIYTPQLVVDGAREMVGSHHAEVMAALREAPHEAIAPVVFGAVGAALGLPSIFWLSALGMAGGAVMSNLRAMRSGK